MLYKKNKDKSIDMALFQAPTAEYRGAPFWAWNCKLDRERILRQIDYFKEMGFGGFHMHSRVGMATPYLSDEFMGHIKACVDKAKDEKMLAWLYDEDRWASGAAGGFVTKDKKFRLKRLQFSKTKPSLYLPKEEAFDQGKPYYLATYDVELDEQGLLIGYRRIDAEAEAKGAKWHATVHVAPDDPWFNNQSYPDTLDEETMQRFIEITYEAYGKAVGEEFNETVPAIFTDEPNFLARESRDGNQFLRAKDEADVSIAWSRFFEEKYQEHYGEDLLDRLPELFWLCPDRRDAETKYRYFDFCAERFAICFADQCGKWCEEHGLALTGHILREPKLHDQAYATGDNMRQYRSYTIPGIDMLCDFIELTTAKQCQSVVHQMGKEAMMSELYGVTNWDFDFRHHKFQGDWQAALGVTVRVPHLSWMSMAGEAKRDYPASIFYQSPWYKDYSYIEDHYARLNVALTRGKPMVKIGLIHPIESYWIQTGPNDQTGEDRKVLNENFEAVTRWLLEGHQDFNFIDESLLPSLCNENPRAVGQMEYDAIVIPDCRTLRQSTLDYLAGFMKAGGKVLFMSDCPQFIGGIRSDAAKKLYEKAEKVPFNKSALLIGLESCRAVDLRLRNGLPAEKFLYQLRQDGEEQWLYIARFEREGMLSNSDQRTLKGINADCQTLEITVNGEWEPHLYDTLSGKVMPIGFRHQGGKTIVTREVYESDSLLIRFSAPHYNQFIPQEKAPLILARKDYKQKVAYRREEANVLLLDLAEYRLDQEDWRPREEILRADNEIRARLGYPMRTEKFAQPWVVPDDPAEHTVSVRYTIHSALKLKGLLLALEDAEKAEILLNGKAVENTPCGWYVDEAIQTVALPPLKKGDSVLEITWPFAKRANLEACYLLGEFDVALKGTEAELIAPTEEIGFGSIAEQGLPFYSGNITYFLPLEAPADCSMKVHLGKYSGALCRVALDEEAAQPLAFAPYDLTFRKVKKGVHTLKITVCGNRFNTFGCVHNCADLFSWYGPDCWRTDADWWSYEYQLKKAGLLISPKVVMYHEK